VSGDVSTPRLAARDRIALWILAVVAALAVGLIAPVYWDSFGYVRQAIDGDVGGLAFGRPLFALVSQLIAYLDRSLGGSIWRLDGLLRVWWLLVSATTAPAAYALSRRCGLTLRAARLAGLIVATSPAFAHTSSAILTDGPSLAVVTWALVAGVDAITSGSIARAALAGVLAGAAIGLREQSVISLAGLALMLPAARTRRLPVAATIAIVALAVAVAPVVYVASIQPGYLDSIARWVSAMRSERATHGFGLRDAGFYLLWLASLGPVMIVVAAIAWTRRTRAVTSGAVLAGVTVPALLQLLALAFYPDIAYSPRYLIAALPGAMAIPAAIAIDPWITTPRRLQACVFACVLPLLAISPLVLRYDARQQDALDDLARDVSTLPDGAVIVTGWMCPAIPLLRSEARVAMGVDPGWEAVCPGWQWPAPLSSALNARRRDGRTVVLDLRASSWTGAEQRRFRDEAAQYAAESISADSVRIWR
jgi:hypothetical protein